MWLAASGLGSVIGLLLVYRGLRIGKVGAVLRSPRPKGHRGGDRGRRRRTLTIPVALVLAIIAIGIAR